MDCLLRDLRGSAASGVNSDPTETGKAPHGLAHGNSIYFVEFHETKLHIFSMNSLWSRKIFLPDGIFQPVFQVPKDVIQPFVVNISGIICDFVVICMHSR